MHRVASVFAIALLTIFGMATPRSAAAVSCTLSAAGRLTGVLFNGVCIINGAPSDTPSDLGGSPPSPTETVFCGRPSSAVNGLWNRQCGAPKFCYDTTATQAGRAVQQDAYATFVQANGTWVLQSVWCPATTTPIPTTQAVREQALRLLPAVAIGSAWTHRALVNAQTILWAATSAERVLPDVTVVGHTVHLRIGFEHASWSFGDQHTDTTTEPGRPYQPTTDACNTAQCPHYYGYTYTHTGPVTITIAWHTQFSLTNTGPWTDVDPAPLTGPTTTHTLTLVQARGILVPNPP